MNPCPYCHATTKQHKNGRTESGSQPCGRRYSPALKQQGYDETIRQQTVKLYSDGLNFRRIARHLGVNHQTVINWVNAYSAQLPQKPPQSSAVSVVKLDELFTFFGEKKPDLPDDAGGLSQQLYFGMVGGD